MKAAHRRAMLHRIPGGDDGGAEAMAQQGDRFRDARVIAFLFKGGVNQHQAALFGKRCQRAQRFPGIALMHGNLRIALEMRLEAGIVFRVKLYRHQPILRAQRRPDQRGGARIEGRKTRLRQRCQIGRQRGAWACHQPQRAAFSFPRALRF